MIQRGNDASTITPRAINIVVCMSTQQGDNSPDEATDSGTMMRGSGSRVFYADFILTPLRLTGRLLSGRPIPSPTG